ncbi:NAD(P)-dependent dehydrogenase (short-subunit alcohol dehydrogenase family) [Scopulibacillus darangshiensis]|uniref:NAD(P)-dependent dehydrogenase (Short-subunit alcohol dehydrogenase family) n=1 Tax=Scopulibacillus darangshiensis TaxID=442528 RepID=A0A4R2NDJ7_9BACL|nr:SDR family oxidoreductase [Scopulibacillus darangshiensis]TCP19158.1 NAD(P)-dependent dehydrogenase (short-subunit alcohol dehydrogenase family) [Scopulibacillus darangshiensis]
MQNRIAVVTGANSGMGLATSAALIKRGFHVIMACRNSERGAKALQQVKQDSGANHVELMTCDLGSLDSIRTFAKQFKERYQRLDVLVNNAGVVSIKRETTADGFESMIGVNHLGHFLLTNLLLDRLKQAKQGRIVTVSSGAHKAGNIHFNDPHLSSKYNVVKGYSQSKLANILFTRELAERLESSSVTANCLHPGAVGTNLGVNRNTGFGKAIHRVLRPFFLTPAEGADTAIYLATSPDVTDNSGEYFYKRKIASISAKARDKALAKKLWAWSEQQVNLT